MHTRMTRTYKVFTWSTALIAAAILALAALSLAYADASAIDFEDPTFVPGTVNGQDGWVSLGAAGSGCAVYDHAVSNSFGVPDFGGQSLRISNAVTSGCFGDQTFAKPLTDAAGEADSTDGTFSRGTLQNHFEAQFDIRPMQLSQQPGLFLSVSPDRGDGSRMSYLGFEDTEGGIDVIFYDTPGTGNPANFSPTTVAEDLSRAVTHTVKFVIDFVDGPSNDIVEIYIDGVLVHTGTTWENYYRYDSEASAEQSPRIIKTLLFRTGGAAAPATLGLGYLIDNVSLTSSTQEPAPTEVTVTIVKYVDGAHATAENAQGLSFPMDASWSDTGFGDGNGSFALSTVGFNNPNAYEATTADMDAGANYSVSEDTTEANVGASCADGKPYALSGYSVGASELDAASAPTSTSASLTDIASDMVIIVWNDTCGATLTLEKTVVNDNDGTSLDTDWTLSASGPTPLSGVEGNASVTNAPVLPGTYDLSEAGPAGYTASAWVCTGGIQVDDDTVTIADGENVICTITNDDDVTVPPPPANACATPGVAPAGYTLQNGTAGNDSVTIAPFTMFVGISGNDIVNGPADGNYIVCTGNGNDAVTLGNGDFTIHAGNGNNTIETGDGDGVITTGAANDTITTGNGVQTITAGNGINTIETGDGDKTVTTGNSIDRITTGAGNDVISAGNGNNIINAGAGNDTVTTGGANDNVNGGPDTDTCSVGGGLNSVVNCEL